MAKTKSKPKLKPKAEKKPAVAKAKKPAKKPVKVAAKAKKPIAKKPVKVAAKPAAKPAAKAKAVKPPAELEVLDAAATPVAPKGKKEAKAKAPKAVDVTLDDKKAEEAEVVLTDAEGRRYCRVQDCDQVAIVEAYCRYHYLLYWKKIQYRKKILADNKFFKYIDELTAKYPDKFLEVIRKDLASQKNFAAAIQEMEIDESSDEADADDKSYMDDMRGIGAEVGSTEESSDDF